MTYTIPVVGQNTIIIPTGSTNTSTCLTLVGKNVPGYGQAINRNLMNMLQNFAGPALPQAAVEGQLWFDTSNRQLKVYNGTTLKTLPMLSFASSTPSYPYTGELWWDSSLNLFKIYNGTIWVVIGPYSVTTSSGAVADSIADSDRVLRSILTFNIDGNVIGVLAKEKFIPLTAYNGLVTIDKGFNLTPAAGVTSNFANITTLRGITITATNISATAIGNANTAVTANTVTTTSVINAGGNIFVSGNIIPTSNVAYDLGNATASWRSLYLSGNTIYFGGIVLKDNGGSLGVFDTTGSTPVPIVIPSLNNTPIGNVTPSTGNFTTITTSSYANVANVITTNGIYWANGLPFVSSLYANSNVAAYLPTYNGTVSSLTTLSGGQLTGYLTGPIGANTANSGAFTTVTTTGNVGIGTTTPTANLQIQSSNDDSVIKLTNTSTANPIAPVLNVSSGTGGSELIFERTQTSFQRNSGYVGGIYWNNSLTNGYVLGSSITATSTNSLTSPNFRLLYQAGHAHVFYTWNYNASGGLTPNTTDVKLSMQPGGSYFPGNLAVGQSATTAAALAVAGNITGYFEGPIGANTANTGAFTTVTTTGNITTTTSGYLGRIGINTATPKGLLQANAAGGAIYLTNTGLNTIDRFNINFEKTDPTQTRLGFVDFMGGLVWNRTLTDNTIASASIIVTGNNYAALPTLNTYYVTLNNHIFQTSTNPVNKDLTPPTRMSISNNGNVYIGTNSNSGNLYVYGSVNGYLEGAIGANTANSGVFTTITTTGNINTTANVIANIAYFTTANVSGNLYAGNIAFSNGFTLLNYINANPTYGNANVSAYLTAYPAGIAYANSNVAAYIASSNLAIATTPTNLGTDGEIQSGRMMARYNAAKGVFFDVNNNGVVQSADALIIARLEPYLNASSGGLEYLQPVLGSNFGSKKVGVGFHVGTSSEIIANAVNTPTSSISGNVNAVVVGYMNNGPRILLMDYALSDNQANVTTYNSTLHRFYGNVGIGVANANVALSVSGSITATGNLTVGNITTTGTVVMGSSFKRNHIINGNMKVAQRGTSFNNVGSGGPLQYTLDRWFGYRTSYAGGLSISQQTGFAGAQYCLRHQRAAGDTNIGNMLIGQIIESSNLIDLQGQNVTVSFWARTGANYSGGSLAVGLATGTTADEGSTAFVSGWTGGSYPFNTTQSITSTATRYTFTGTVPSNALEMIFHIVWTPSGTAGAADYIEITNVQIEPGIVATPYEYQKINEQLAECQRYCFTIPAAGGAYAVYPGTAISTTSTFVFVTYPVTPRRAFTSITVKGLNSYYDLINWSNSGTGSATGITLLDSSINVGTISITTTAGSPTISAGNSIGLRLQNVGATLVFEGAEL